MTDRAPHLVLHIGAPKCGSSALQTALSMTPDLRAADGTKYRYTAAGQTVAGLRALQGRQVTQAAHLSPYGYVSWPNLGKATDPQDVFQVMRQVMDKGQRRGHVPILSCEGWINHADTFAQTLAAWGHPPVDVVIFLRPVVDWMNAAFWQWGVWHARTLDRWIERSNMPYSFAQDIVAWSAIPNLRLSVRSQRPDVIAKFADLYGLPLTSDRQSNTASSAGLIGFLMRNRRFRETGHQAATEFTVQRWCPPAAGPKLWAVQAKHVHQMRPVNTAALRILRAQLSADDLEDLLSDPRWTSEQPYHADMLSGVTWMNDVTACAPLLETLFAGATAACQQADLPRPDFPEVGPDEDDLEVWDTAISPVLETLLQADAVIRNRSVPTWKRRAVQYLAKREKS